MTKSSFARSSTNFPFLSVTRTGSITYSAPALSEKEGASGTGVGPGAWAAIWTAAAESRAERRKRFTD